MSEADKNKLGTKGSKLNTDGEHLLTITEAFEIDGSRFVLAAEDASGRKVDWTGFLTAKVGEKDGVVKAGEYSVNGVKTYLDNKDATYDNLRTIGEIRNLWKICGLDADTFGDGIEPGTKVYSKAGAKPIESWTKLIGKKFTGITSFLIQLDQDGKKAWRTQSLDMGNLFTADRLSQMEVDKGETTPVAIEVAIKDAKANPSIEYKNKNNKICIQELKLVQSAGTVPATESAGTTADTGAGEDPF